MWGQIVGAKAYKLHPPTPDTHIPVDPICVAGHKVPTEGELNRNQSVQMQAP